MRTLVAGCPKASYGRRVFPLLFFVLPRVEGKVLTWRQQAPEALRRLAARTQGLCGRVTQAAEPRAKKRRIEEPAMCAASLRNSCVASGPAWMRMSGPYRLRLLWGYGWSCVQCIAIGSP